MKRILAIGMSMVLTLSAVMFPEMQVFAEEEQERTGRKEQQTTEAEVEIQAPSAILMEASTGAVLYEKDADTRRAPASVTKIMTMILIFDALESGKIHLEDEVTTSEYAASMGGSQVFLEPGETQTVDTMLKCISVASANDACAAMAEYIAGSEEAFVKMMNERAAELGMTNTTFQNCNGLDTEGHLTTARDIGRMSRKLITKYPKIHKYCMIWMDTITHITKKGTTEFGLSNTNKLVRQYPYATGLKTGSTDEAKFCVSATAQKDGMDLIAVILGGENSKQRFQDATRLLNYGFGKCQVYEDKEPPKLKLLPIEGGVKEEIGCEYKERFRYLDTSGDNLASVTKKIKMKQSVKAPVRKGQKVGELTYYLGKKKIGSVEILAKETCRKAEFLDYLKKVIQKLRV